MYVVSGSNMPMRGDCFQRSTWPHQCTSHQFKFCWQHCLAEAPRDDASQIWRACLHTFAMHDTVGIFEGYLSSYHLIVTSQKSFLRRPCRSSESTLSEEKPIEGSRPPKPAKRETASESQRGTKMATETGGVKQRESSDTLTRDSRADVAAIHRVSQGDARLFQTVGCCQKRAGLVQSSFALARTGLDCISSSIGLFSGETRRDVT